MRVFLRELRRFLGAELLYDCAAGGTNEVQRAVGISFYLGRVLGTLDAAVSANVSAAAFRDERVLGNLFSAVGADKFTR